MKRLRLEFFVGLIALVSSAQLNPVPLILSPGTVEDGSDVVFHCVFESTPSDINEGLVVNFYFQNCTVVGEQTLVQLRGHLYLSTIKIRRATVHESGLYHCEISKPIVLPIYSEDDATFSSVNILSKTTTLTVLPKRKSENNLVLIYGLIGGLLGVTVGVTIRITCLSAKRFLRFHKTRSRGNAPSAPLNEMIVAPVEHPRTGRPITVRRSVSIYSGISTCSTPLTSSFMASALSLEHVCETSGIVSVYQRGSPDTRTPRSLSNYGLPASYVAYHKTVIHHTSLCSLDWIV